MKTFTIVSSLLLLLSGSLIEAQSNIKWQEMFDNQDLPEGWLNIDADEGGSGWKLVQSDTTPGGQILLPQSGQSFFSSNVQDANLAGVIDEWLISPRISVIYAGDSLYFWAGAVNELFDDSLRVMISTLDNNISSFDSTLGYFRVDGPAGSWHRYGFDLSDYDSSDIYIGINYYVKDGGPGGANSDYMWFDHILVTGDPATINNAPVPVALELPVDESVLDIESSTVDFQWSASNDLDGDNLNYTVSIVNVFPQMRFPGIGDTLYSLNWQDLLNVSTTYRWTVEVTDGKSRVASPDTFSFRIKNPLAVNDHTEQIPGKLTLFQNYPNPFNPTTTIACYLPKPDIVTLTVYDITGRRVRTLADHESQPAGRLTKQFDGSGLSSGIYYYKIQTPGTIQMKKMLLVR